MKQSTILLLDFEPTSIQGLRLQEILEPSSSSTVHVRRESGNMQAPDFGLDRLREVISDYDPSLIFLIIPPDLLKQAGFLFKHLGGGSRLIPIIAVTEAGQPDDMFSLLRLGAADFVTTPLKEIDILPRVWRLMEKTRPGAAATCGLKEQLGLRQLVGESPTFMAEIAKIPAIAKCDASVFISGETGTGKELCARAIHYLSPRAHKPFIPVNCGAVPLELVENEVFGHERGAFTGATTAQLGLIREADGGTLFLDEIDCLPLLAQVKFLRFLQEKEYRPLGSTRMFRADVRVIAATNINCAEAVRTGKLRRDLYYRLNVIPLALPPLRQRQEDIAVLARHFLASYADEFEKQILDLSPEALYKLQVYHWPGNVRELEYLIERAVVLSDHEIIRDSDIVIAEGETAIGEESFQEAKAKVVSNFESTYIQQQLTACQGNITKAAQKARKNRRAFWQLIRKHKIDVQHFKIYAS